MPPVLFLTIGAMAYFIKASCKKTLIKINKVIEIKDYHDLFNHGEQEGYVGQLFQDPYMTKNHFRIICRNMGVNTSICFTISVINMTL